MGGTCVALPCPTGQIACGTGCVDPNTNPQFCGASGDCTGMHAGTVCRPDQYCSGGRCNETFGRYSYISPGVNLTNQTRARPTRYEIGTAFPATIYWTVDGSTPAPGAPATRTSPSPLDLGVLNDGANVQWYADFGPPMGPEPTIHQLLFHVNATGQHSSGQIVEGLRIAGGFGPVAVVAPGTVFSLTTNWQYWHADSMGYCPGCAVYWGLNFAGQTPTTAPFCANNGITWTGTASSGTGSFTAPTVPGRYAILSNNALDFHCDPGGEEIGEVFVY